MGKISENEIWMPEPESKVSQTSSFSPGQTCAPQSGCSPCLDNPCGACPMAKFCIPHMLMVFIFVESPEECCYLCLWGQEPGTNILEPGGIQSAGDQPSFAQSHSFKPNMASFQSQVTLLSLSHSSSGWQKYKFTLTLLPTPCLVLGEPCDLCQVKDVCHSHSGTLPTQVVRKTLQLYHLLSPPGCSSQTIPDQLLGEEPAICAGAAVPA